MKPFNRERFLFYLLGGIFIWQATIFSFAVWGCFAGGGLKACPELGKRYENTVNVMVATTLALLTGSVVKGMQKTQKTAQHPILSPRPQRLSHLEEDGQHQLKPSDYYLAELRHYICGVNL